MKKSNLDELFKLLKDKGASRPDHFLFLLGTETRYTPNPDDFYESAETFSYIAQLITQGDSELNNPQINIEAEAKLEEKSEENSSGVPISSVEKELSGNFLTENVDLLIGPNRIGTDVGLLIARAVFLALRAVACGKTTLHIGGHSRGAVEAMLVIHELERIKSALDPKNRDENKTLWDILIASPCRYTKDAIKNNFPKPQVPDDEANDYHDELFKRLTALKTSAFLIDPVPGDSSIGIPYYGWLGWHDNRFYQELPCSKVKLFICRDERSQNFRAILPKGITPIIIPGSHCTPSGRLTNHYGQKVKGNVSDVQKLMICQLLEFFDCSINLNNSAKHPLNSVAYEYLHADPRNRQVIILRHYEQIFQNDIAYRSLTQSTYFGGYRPECSPTNQRIVNIANGCVLDRLYSDMKDFVNTEHAALYMRTNFELQNMENADLTVIVLAITANIRNLKLAADSQIDQRLREILNNKEATPLFFNSFAVLIDAISQKYVQNHLTNDEGKLFIKAIKEPFHEISEIQEQPENIQENHKVILIKLKEKLQDSLKETIEKHAKETTQRCTRLSEEISASFEQKNENDNVCSVQHLHNIELLYSACKMLHSTYDDLNSLLDEKKKLQFYKYELKIHCKNLVMIAGEIVYNKKLDLDGNAEQFPEYFYKKVKAEAEKLNAPHVAADALVRLQAAENRARRLISKEETTCGHHIHHKLIPLTEQYLSHLNAKAKYYPNPVKQALNPISAQEDLACAQLDIKQDAVHFLLAILTNGDLTPSERIQQFASTLHETQADLQLHRDTSWKHYSKACLADFANLPNVIGLRRYENKVGSLPLFFKQIHGQRTIQESQNLLFNRPEKCPEIIPESPPHQ